MVKTGKRVVSHGSNSNIIQTYYK